MFARGSGKCDVPVPVAARSCTIALWLLLHGCLSITRSKPCSTAACCHYGDSNCLPCHDPVFGHQLAHILYEAFARFAASSCLTCGKGLYTYKRQQIQQLPILWAVVWIVILWHQSLSSLFSWCRRKGGSAQQLSTVLVCFWTVRTTSAFRFTSFVPNGREQDGS